MSWSRQRCRQATVPLHCWENSPEHIASSPPWSNMWVPVVRVCVCGPSVNVELDIPFFSSTSRCVQPSRARSRRALRSLWVCFFSAHIFRFFWCHSNLVFFVVGQAVWLPPNTTVLRVHHKRTGTALPGTVNPNMNIRFYVIDHKMFLELHCKLW